MGNTRVFFIGLFASVLATALTVFIAAGAAGGGIIALNPLELAAVATSYGCTLLFGMQRRQAYLWGGVTTALYSVFFFTSVPAAPASAFVQIYLLGALVYGFFRWGPDGNPRPVTLVKLPWWGVYAVVTAATWFGAVWISQYFGYTIQGWDAAILGLSILAQWLLDNKKAETWAVWVLVNLIAVPFYWSQGYFLVGVQYAFFLLHAVYWWIKWVREARETPLDRALREGSRLRNRFDGLRQNGDIY